MMDVVRSRGDMIQALGRYGLACLLCCVLASVAAAAHAQAPGVTPPVTAPEGAAAGAPAPAAEAAPSEPLPSDTDGTVEAPAPVASSAGGRAALEQRLHELERERAHWTNFWPWLVVGTGATMVLTGTIMGVARAFSCEENTKCSSPPWATLIVVVGAAVGSVGGVWLVATDNGIRELEIQTNRVRMDIEQLDHAQLRLERGVAKLSEAPALNLHVRF
jgi:hypothetical protein